MTVDDHIKKFALDAVQDVGMEALDEEIAFDPGFQLVISKTCTGITIHDDTVLNRLKALARAKNITLDDYLNKLLFRIQADICGKERMKTMDESRWASRTPEGMHRRGII